MKIVLSNEAMAWFKEEMETTSGEYIRFYARYGGSSQLHEGFSLGVTKEYKTHSGGIQTETDGITFYIEESDIWYLDGNDMLVELNSATNELEFNFSK